MQRIAEPPFDQRYAKSRTRMPGKLMKFRTRQSVNDVVVVNSHCPLSNLNEQWLSQFVQVASAKLLMKGVSVESFVVKVVKYSSESMVISVAVRSSS